ncbi:MAG: DUF547 domain-containing protein [Desulfobacterales bacterium]|nr:DUF547 domain-containing protein [Deltaproteobacteria bacterium]NNK94612.1 DUF547 domain-containing protein [Desulfobacterales bacterium]
MQQPYAKMITSHHALFLFLPMLILLHGCTSIRPASTMGTAVNAPQAQFSYTSYATLLRTNVSERGLVDYQALSKNQQELDRFYAQIAQQSPDSHPHLFPTQHDQLAYWINAYNATVIKGVLEYYPISSVEAVKPPALLFFFPSKSGFFFFNRFIYGGRETSLYYLENKVIRERFEDPRFHFALNCASSSCPKLPRTPFLPETLAKQLDQETRRFINNEQNVRFDATNQTLYLSAIFKWYEEDFSHWLHAHHPELSPTLTSYVLLYFDPETAASIKREQAELKIEFIDYDWALNDTRRQ